MVSVIKQLREKNLIHPPGFVEDNVQYETIMGSVAYGVSSDNSDVDVYGFCIPPKRIVFPHLAGIIPGFGTPPEIFNQYQKHHIADPSTKKEYDVTIYNIVKYFQLAMENNPNILDSLFTPRRCVIHSTAVSEMVREARKDFLHKGSWFKFKGYAYSQLHKAASGKSRKGKRKEIYDKFGFDVKFMYHVVRLLYEAEMILTEKDIDLERHREHLKAIRRGDISEDEIKDWAAAKEKDLELKYSQSKIPVSPDESTIKKLLIECLEHHYGSIEKAIGSETVMENTLRTIQREVDKIRNVLN